MKCRTALFRSLCDSRGLGFCEISLAGYCIAETERVSSLTCG